MKQGTKFIQFFTTALMLVVMLFVVDSAKHKVSTKTETKTQKAAKDSVPVVSEQSVEVVLPSHNFHFEAVEFNFPVAVFFADLPQFVFKYYSKPFFRLAFIDNIFERFVVTNAP